MTAAIMRVGLLFDYPFCTIQVRLPAPIGAIGIVIRISMQHDAGYFAPISAFRFGVEEARVCYEVRFVVGGDCIGGWRFVGDVGIEDRFAHRVSLTLSRAAVYPVLGWVAHGRRPHFMKGRLHQG